MVEFIQKESLLERIYWLIRLRWIAIVGVITTILFVKNALLIPLVTAPLYGVISFLGIYNLIFLLYLNRLKEKKKPNLVLIANRFANIQISLDLLSLTLLIHFSGGIENPFIFYFIFHMIIASILLSRRASYLQATFATLLLISMVGLEYFGILSHHYLEGFSLRGLYTNKLYIAGVSFVFVSTLYLAVYMASSISEKLRLREQSLKQANLLLEEKDRIKSEYVLRVSHDIKEHLSAIQSCLEPVEDGITGELNLKQKDLIQRAVERTGKLLFFVKALLEISRIKLSKEIEMDYFSLKKTIADATNFIDTRAKNKIISIEFKIDPGLDLIWGAQIYIEETIANLLANCVKYTLKNGKISLEAKDRGNSVLIKVTDTGIGIPKEEIPKVFDEFYRASNAKELERDGTGLGLAIAKQVVERHKGKIWVESEEGKGSTFYILLPKSK
ncbi:MAG: HAMP domain-containing sensor histidine kinase [Candidatus Omnitrophota bacterium]